MASVKSAVTSRGSDGTMGSTAPKRFAVLQLFGYVGCEVSLLNAGEWAALLFHQGL
jgi:coenzyme F420-reducing hydrogenase gamma subunit